MKHKLSRVGNSRETHQTEKGNSACMSLEARLARIPLESFQVNPNTFFCLEVNGKPQGSFIQGMADSKSPSDSQVKRRLRWVKRMAVASDTSSREAWASDTSSREARASDTSSREAQRRQKAAIMEESSNRKFVRPPGRQRSLNRGKRAKYQLWLRYAEKDGGVRK